MCLRYATLPERATLVNEVVWSRVREAPAILTLAAETAAGAVLEMVVQCADRQQFPTVSPPARSAAMVQLLRR
jgi:hypothetical protein